MTTTDTHAKLLALLTERFPEKVPHDGEGRLLRWLCDSESYSDAHFHWGPSLDRDCISLDLDAHAHILLAAWWAVREWCKGREAGLVVSDIGCLPVALTACWMKKGVGIPSEMQFYQPLGQGPDDPSALLAALTTIAGEKP
jgi:hypothetical protein